MLLYNLLALCSLALATTTSTSQSISANSLTAIPPCTVDEQYCVSGQVCTEKGSNPLCFSSAAGNLTNRIGAVPLTSEAKTLLSQKKGGAGGSGHGGGGRARAGGGGHGGGNHNNASKGSRGYEVSMMEIIVIVMVAHAWLW